MEAVHSLHAEQILEDLRGEVCRSARNEPGVYLMRNAGGEVLYVGKSTQVRTRLLSYFRLPWPEHRHARMLRETRKISWEPLPSEFAALLKELRLIRTHLPKYNSRSARPLDRLWVITIGAGAAPRLKVERASAALRSHLPARIVGPFTSRRTLLEALRVLNDALGLRDCSDRVAMHMNDDQSLFESDHPALHRTPGCHRFETGRCMGPCVGAVSEYRYHHALERAIAVLEGRDHSPQQQIVKEMASASAALSYERAGWLRDRLAALQGLEAQLQRVRDAAATANCVCAVHGRDGDHRLYLIRNGLVHSEAAVADSSDLQRMREQAGAVTTLSDTLSAIERLDELWLVESWLAGRSAPRPLVSDSVDGAIELLLENQSTTGSGTSSTSA